MALLLAHLIVLFSAAYVAAGGLVRGAVDRVLTTFLLVWANLVATSLLLTSLERLGHTGWFFRTSLLLALATWLLLRRARPAPTMVAGPAGFDWKLVAALAVTLAPIIYASIRIAATYEPNNYDSLTYHLPRTMYYLGQGHLGHFDTGNDRQIYFPFNFNLLQLTVLIYGAPLQALNFINLATWGISGLAVYRLSRRGGLSINFSLIGAWLALTSTQVLAQATATTNDLPTAAGLLSALVFALRWRETRLTRDALLGGLAAGLTVGTKLTVLFFGPAAGLLVLGFGYRHWREDRLPEFFKGVRSWIAPGILALAIASPFALINIAEKGQWINTTYDFTLNRPFAIGSVVQTSSAYLVQLFIEPLHRFTHDLRFTEQLNLWGARTFFPNWNAAYAFSPLYLFPPDLNEDHVWFGFTGPLVFLAAVFCLLRRKQFPLSAVWLAWVGLGWLITYFTLNKWSLYNQRYFVPVILVMAPCLAAVLAAGWASPSWRRTVRGTVVGLAVCTLWLSGVYLFNNTSRPYAPLWAGTPPPPALPSLPPLLVQRLSIPAKVNIHSTDGNERIFLLMTLGRNQRFTASATVAPDAYNVFSEWGFPRKVAYSNIEQLSSYTVVEVPTKRTAGVEFLGTLGQGQPALDYYGLVPQAAETPSGGGNRQVLIELYYGPREPNRYERLEIRVAGLNAPDEATLTVGVDYEDGTSQSLAEFHTTGKALASVVRPLRRFTVRVNDINTGEEVGSIDIPYLFRDKPPEFEAALNPSSLFAHELITATPPAGIASDGLAEPEGPYPEWNLPLVRWAKSPVLRLELPPAEGLERIELNFSLRLQAREQAMVDVILNGELVKNYRITGRTNWLDQKLELPVGPGMNVVEFRNVSVGTETDWLDYLERYPDVKEYVLAQGVPLERGAQEHWAAHGRFETRSLNLQRRTERLSGEDQLYYVFRRLHVEGLGKP